FGERSGFWLLVSGHWLLVLQCLLSTIVIPMEVLPPYGRQNDNLDLMIFVLRTEFIFNSAILYQ
ncbi:MAG: hypothetical protein K8R63_02515, partial [Bacteroidales bacterium]|nr:hypothetical protein [Bacteroidales bacterium]